MCGCSLVGSYSIVSMGAPLIQYFSRQNLHCRTSSTWYNAVTKNDMSASRARRGRARRRTSASTSPSTRRLSRPRSRRLGLRRSGLIPAGVRRRTVRITRAQPPVMRIMLTMMCNPPKKKGKNSREEGADA